MFLTILCAIFLHQHGKARHMLSVSCSAYGSASVLNLSAHIHEKTIEMPISAEDKLGIADLLIADEQNIPTLLQVAKSVTRNVCDIATAQEALDYICTHLEDTSTLLHKRSITKEILFKYLHRQKVAVTSDFTKVTLIQKVIECWHNRTWDKSENAANTLNGQMMIDATHLPETASITNYAQQSSAIYLPATEIIPNYAQHPVVEPSQYPIHLLARKFSEWFFENYNKGNLKLEDFWSDAHLTLRIAATDQIHNNECMGSDGVIASLMQYKQQFGFFFNPNLTHAGVQGRMDVHGLVLVLGCGTLHTQQNCVGVFECTFGLLRDPYAENNWKLKTIQCMLRSDGASRVPSLYESDTLRAALELPVPMGEFT